MTFCKNPTSSSSTFRTSRSIDWYPQAHTINAYCKLLNKINFKLVLPFQLSLNGKPTQLQALPSGVQDNQRAEETSLEKSWRDDCQEVWVQHLPVKVCREGSVESAWKGTSGLKQSCLLLVQEGVHWQVLFKDSLPNWSSIICCQCTWKKSNLWLQNMW